MASTQQLSEATRTAPGQTTKPSTSRLICLDIFRGLAVAGMILVDNPGSDEQAFSAIKHAQWNGWTPADFIFPSFLFLVGVSMMYSFPARLARGQTKVQILQHAFVRSLILIAIGLLVNASPIVGLDIHTWRFEGVTQRIALCYFATAVLVLWSDTRGFLVALFACLFGYWAMLRFIPVPGFGVPGRDIPFMDPDRNIVAWLDRLLFPGRLYNGTRDPEGIISTIPAIATTIMGVLAGKWLRTDKPQVAKVKWLLAAGISGLLLGVIWDRWFPINKNLWTSSFAVFSGGFALFVLGCLYWILEIKNWRGRWTMPILVFGMNAIAGFVADSLVYGPGYTFQMKGPAGTPVSWHEGLNARLLSVTGNPQVASLIYSLAAVGSCWVLLWLLWRKRIFLKI
ncbi:MAG TPA: heparan-alpha-glucosaminide N-acetyltransferase domain-containing protein [Terriglobales bacterium]|nr:heparan-alpha-glucosaminide N-acetyltransferase domain-containing protein [Terriglobales bacterium]